MSKLPKIKYANNVQYYTIMDFSAVIHDVICTKKIIIDQGDSRGQ